MKTVWILVLVFIALLTFSAITDYGNPGPQHPQRCEEDMPCWNCNTMGNKICGTR